MESSKRDDDGSCSEEAAIMGALLGTKRKSTEEKSVVAKKKRTPKVTEEKKKHPQSVLATMGRFAFGAHNKRSLNAKAATLGFAQLADSRLLGYLCDIIEWNGKPAAISFYRVLLTNKYTRTFAHKRILGYYLLMRPGHHAKTVDGLLALDAKTLQKITRDTTNYFSRVYNSGERMCHYCLKTPNLVSRDMTWVSNDQSDWRTDKRAAWLHFALGWPQFDRHNHPVSIDVCAICFLLRVNDMKAVRSESDLPERFFSTDAYNKRTPDHLVIPRYTLAEKEEVTKLECLNDINLKDYGTLFFFSPKWEAEVLRRKNADFEKQRKTVEEEIAKLEAMRKELKELKAKRAEEISKFENRVRNQKRSAFWGQQSLQVEAEKLKLELPAHLRPKRPVSDPFTHVVSDDEDEGEDLQGPPPVQEPVVIDLIDEDDPSNEGEDGSLDGFLVEGDEEEEAAEEGEQGSSESEASASNSDE